MKARVEELGEQIQAMYNGLKRDHQKTVDEYYCHPRTVSRDKDGFKFGLVIGDSIVDCNIQAVLACLEDHTATTFKACVEQSIIDGLKASALFTDFPAEWRVGIATSVGHEVLDALARNGLQKTATAIILQ
jgi:hypothetical protein